MTHDQILLYDLKHLTGKYDMSTGYLIAKEQCLSSGHSEKLAIKKALISIITNL